MLEERKFLQDILFLGSLNPKSGSFIIDLRLQRHFTVFTMFTPGQDTIKTIYGSILGGHVKEWADPVTEKLVQPLINGTIHIFNKILKDTRYSPSAKKFHY
jgi:dynein heavy chain